MKEVNMYVRGSSVADGSTSVVVLEYNGRRKITVYKNPPMNTHRAILFGFLNGVAMLKEPCIINAYTHCTIGITSKIKGINIDVKTKLIDLITERGHMLNFNVSTGMQNHMIKIIRNTKYINQKVIHLKDIIGDK